MGMKRKQVKVSGMVSPATHAQMAAVAKQERTTIGAIIQWAVRLALGELARNPDAAKTLEPDARPETNRRLHKLRKRKAA